jgi:hypothetical protein
MFGYCDQFDNIYHIALAFFQQAQMQTDLSALILRFGFLLQLVFLVAY